MEQAKRIVANRLAGTRLEAVTAANEDEGYALQAQANERLREHLGARAGYKIGATTEAMRELLRVEQPVAGEIFERTVV
ncbi:MAG: hypothetical protein KDH19_19250, partial [Geminicoccaceae bacterium]|nr:hypothetical protein [Geminicoccaceae bacterium]